MKNKLNSSLKKVVLPLITAWMLLSGCGGGWWTNGWWNNWLDNGNSGWKSTTMPVGGNGEKKEYIVWQVKAWPVANAEVVIEDLYWNEIYRIETNWTGYYTIDKEKFKAILEDYGYNFNTELKVYTIWWEDIDVNDDGVYRDSKYVNGSLLALLTWNEIKDSKINPITTLISNYLLNVLQDPSKKDEIAKKLWFKNYASVLKYDMENQESDVEKAIREKYLNYIYEGDDSKLEEVWKNIIYWKNY